MKKSDDFSTLSSDATVTAHTTISVGQGIDWEAAYEKL